MYSFMEPHGRWRFRLQYGQGTIIQGSPGKVTTFLEARWWRGEVEEKNKGSRAATEDPLQGRGIESACAERQKVVCLVSSWLENHVVPALMISKARARVSGTGCFLLVFVVISRYFSLLLNFHGCDFWVVRISFNGYSCTRKAHFDPDCHR